MRVDTLLQWIGVITIFEISTITCWDDSSSGINQNYEYRYFVVDENTGDVKSQEERKVGDEVIGRYTVGEPTGDLRVVSYNANKDGFQADVKYEEGGSPYSNVAQQKQIKSRSEFHWLTPLGERLSTTSVSLVPPPATGYGYGGKPATLDTSKETSQSSSSANSLESSDKSSMSSSSEESRDTNSNDSSSNTANSDSKDKNSEEKNSSSKSSAEKKDDSGSSEESSSSSHNGSGSSEESSSSSHNDSGSSEGTSSDAEGKSKEANKSESDQSSEESSNASSAESSEESSESAEKSTENTGGSTQVPRVTYLPPPIPSENKLPAPETNQYLPTIIYASQNFYNPMDWIGNKRYIGQSTNNNGLKYILIPQGR